MDYYKFNQNKQCEYFPCHKGIEKEGFNCLFCYCPLYMLENKCGGNFKITKGVKDCSDCTKPHDKDGFEFIMSKMKVVIQKGSSFINDKPYKTVYYKEEQMKLPGNVFDIFGDEDTVKIISSISEAGTLHSVSVGSLRPLNEEQLCAFEIFMKTTSEDMLVNKNVTILIVKGTDSYLINAVAAERLTEGDVFDSITENTITKDIHAKAIWIFNIDTVYDQSTTTNEGTKLA